ncbi:MAG: GDP-mannose 4,6-dehydratase [Candidatus Gracilibacteria bacterium]|nr:GDP-mannose 4,6-dehydratase [Candidatus Gracilibacteria bacterium]
MNKVALITGVNGQDGAYLSNFLIEKGYKIIGILKSKNSNLDNLKYFNIEKLIHFQYSDLSDSKKIEEIILKTLPDEIYNLGGLTSPGESWLKVNEYVNVNINSILGIINGVKNSNKVIKIFQASTSEMFGNSNNLGLQTENTPFHPTNPYAVTKLFGYWMTNIFKESNNLYIVNGILFNHESPLRNIKFVTRKISDGIAKIKLGYEEFITLGNINSKRDWGFAGDFVEGFWMSLQQDKADNYIFSTGEIHTISNFLEIGFKHVGIDNWEKYVKIDEKYNRPINLMNLYGKNSKAKDILGWSPKVKFDSLVKIMIDEDIKRLKNNKYP